MEVVDIPLLHCYRCGYSWYPVRPVVRMCPRCKSTLWNQPKLRIPTYGGGQGIDEVLIPHLAAIRLLAKKCRARNIMVFGSVARRQAGPNSDVDLLVEWPKHLRGADPIGFASGLRDLLSRSVDVVTEEELNWQLRPQVLAEAVPL